MKISILTIQSINYGNRLQNYALQQTLMRFGHEVESLRRDPGLKGPAQSKYRFLRSYIGRIRHLRDSASCFRRFDRKIHFSKLIVHPRFVSPGIESEYDGFVVGSDQVWNPDFDFNSELDYLPFVERHNKISYAASFGVSNIVSNRERIGELLKGFSALSVREDAGSRIVRSLAGVEAEVVLDPTLLLDAEEWSDVEERPRFIHETSPFLLKYVLGEDIHVKDIEQFALKEKLQIVDLCDKTLPVGPAEFIWLISHAKLVCTDSFHASIFSLLFHRPFVIFERRSADADMSSRFDSLCRIFGMEHHRFSSVKYDWEKCLNEDWPGFEMKLSLERGRSFSWLTDALCKVGA